MDDMQAWHSVALLSSCTQAFGTNFGYLLVKCSKTAYIAPPALSSGAVPQGAGDH
jgi:hypothetical protein